MTIEQKIRAIMKVTGWKQQEVAEVFEVSQSTVNRWLSGSEPEGPRRDAINAVYKERVEKEQKPDDGLVRTPDEVQKLLHRIVGLTPDNKTALLAAITGFQEINASLSLPTQQDDRSELASARRESSPS